MSAVEKGSHPLTLRIFYEENKSIQMSKGKKKHLKNGKCWKKPARRTYTFKYQSSRELAICKASRISSVKTILLLGKFIKMAISLQKKLFFLSLLPNHKSMCEPMPIPWSPNYTQWWVHTSYTPTQMIKCLPRVSFQQYLPSCLTYPKKQKLIKYSVKQNNFHQLKEMNLHMPWNCSRRKILMTAFGKVMR